MNFPRKIFSGYHGNCHCQGIALDQKNGYIYYSFTTKLIKADLNGNIIGSVDGLIGHLGCIDFCEQDGRVYGSLEYKNDIIGREILKTLHLTSKEIENGFYCVIFDVDKINRLNMDAERDGIMRAVYLSEVTEDYEANSPQGVPHKYGCSGIDGLGWGPMWGSEKGKEYLRVCYGVYGDRAREDNDYQIILTYDAKNWWDTIAKPLNQGKMHHLGENSISKCFVKTGSTNWGVQNLEYDSYKKRWMLAVYRGGKPQFPNYDMFFISANEKPKQSIHSAYNEEILELPVEKGIYFPYGSTGMYAFGNGYYYFSKQGQDKDLGQYTNVALYKACDNEEFKIVE
ncbi:MAG: hypothetical protein IJ400_04490 [Clostridia bacterium]|nr:hypothetical protein [Clostridia bacterium]